MKNFFRRYLKRRFYAQSKSTQKTLSLHSPQLTLDQLRHEIEENHEWAHASAPTFRDLWKRFWLWAYLRRVIKSAPPTPPYMKKVGPRSYVEIPQDGPDDWPREFLGDSNGDPEYWKTHEPVFSSSGLPPARRTEYWRHARKK